jgi:hypothetical protein
MRIFLNSMPKKLCVLAAIFWYGSIGLSAETGLTLSWTNNLLTVSGATVPGGKLEILYLEAFCRKGSTQREWGKTVLPHKTKLLSAESDHLRFQTSIQPNALMFHEVRSSNDAIHFQFALTNGGDQPLDLEWFQPACIRVARFTGSDQSNYTARSFIFTDGGLTTLSNTRRRQEAVYRGGQVYVPKNIDLADVNPRPISLDNPVTGLIGCFSADGTRLLATASSSTHELFEGVFVCLHSDPHVGGLGPHETKKIEAMIYLLENNPEELLKRYRHDFPRQGF